MSVICPCCEQEFASDIKLKNHITKIEDVKHKALTTLYKDFKLKCKDIVPFYEEFKGSFVLPTSEEIVAQITKQREEKQKEAKQRQITARDEERLQKHLEELKRIKELEELRRLKENEANYKLSQLDKKDSPKALLQEFYNMINGKAYSYAVETKMIKNLITKYELTPDQIRLIFKYMVFTGKTRIMNINYYIQDGLRYCEEAKKCKEEGTVPHLIRYYYRTSGKTFNKAVFLKEVDTINGTKYANDLTYEQCKNIVDYMIATNAKSLLFFPYNVQYADTVLTKDVSREEKEINDIVDEVMKGNLKVTQIRQQIQKQCLVLTRKKYFNKEISDKYNFFEWAYKVDLNLDREMYNFAKDNPRESRFNYLFSVTTDTYKLEKLKKAKKAYEEWLGRQPIESGA